MSNIITKTLNKYFNKDVKKAKKITSEIIERQNYRIRESIASWRYALSKGESFDDRDRRDLFRIYNEILLDSHLKGIMDLRKEKLLGYTFDIIDESGEKDELLTNTVFKSQWFYDFLDISIESMYYGFSLIQLDGIYKNNISSVTNIKRENVIIETGEYVKDTQNYLDRNSYLPKPIYKWLVEVFKDRNDLGLLSGIVPLVLWKRNAEQAWSEYSEIFGMPVVIAKTTSNVAEDRERLENFVKDLGKSAWAVLDQNEEIEFIDSNRSDVSNIYNELITLMNKEMSKIILGATMITDDGSSYSQSETHNRQLNAKTKSDLRRIEFLVNDVLIPKLRELGIINKNVKFRFDDSEILTLDEQSIIDERLNNMYPLDKIYLEDKYRVKFTEITAPINEENV